MTKVKPFTNEIVVECQCHDMTHRVRFSYDNEDNNWLCEVVAGSGTVWYRRIASAFNHIFRQKDIEYAEVIMNVEQTQLLARTIVLKDMAVPKKE